MRTIILTPLLLVAASFAGADTLDEQINALKAQADSLSRVAHQLAGAKYAARQDSLVAAEPIIKATKLHIRATSRDSAYVVIDMDSCSALNRQIIRGSLKSNSALDLYQEGDELWIRWRAFERFALPQLKKDLQ